MLLKSSSEGYVKVLQSTFKRNGTTTRATYLKLLVFVQDSSFVAHRVLPAGANISVDSCYAIRYANSDPTVIEGDFTSTIKCPDKEIE